jgi:hypothetical protein
MEELEKQMEERQGQLRAVVNRKKRKEASRAEWEARRLEASQGVRKEEGEPLL